MRFTVPLLLTIAIGAGIAAADDRITGYEELGPELKAMQDDPFMNPGMLWVSEGEALWSSIPEGATQSCKSCHGDVESMKGVAARYPSYDEETSTITDLTGRIMACQERHQGIAPSARDSRELVALTAFISRQSNGMPITPDPDPRLTPWRKRGAELYQTRLGQLNLSCAHCHDDNGGERLMGALIPQAHPTGYPQYRLEWEEMGSLHRRLNNCTTGVRSIPFGEGSEEYMALELFLMDHASGLPIEAPAIRP